MSIKIKTIIAGSSADDLGILPGEKLISINGKKIRDFLDLQFYSADLNLSLEIERLNGKTAVFEIEESWHKPLGITAEDYVCRQCANNCIFCFIDQMPPGKRDSLYIKDDDFCYSFYYGNFITLTNLSQRDLERIVEQSLMPLYISVHTTNSELHKEMLRYRQDFDLMKRLRYLCDNETTFHTQIVIVPGYNDGIELERTLKDLDSLGYCCETIGIVPVGLTRFREGLTKLRPINEEEAKALIAQADKYDRTWCSDEIYLKAKIDLPDFDDYEDFDQIENGIGMIRMAQYNWNESKEDFVDYIRQIDKKLIFVTAELAEDFISEIVTEINQAFPGKARCQKVINHYFGNTVTVAGLITWQDINSQVTIEPDEIAVFASNSFNREGYTIDGVHQKEIAAQWKDKIIVMDEQFVSWDEVTTDGE